MTKRLYYTCPIQALYMIKNFGVVCEVEEKCLSQKADPLSSFLSLQKIYVAPESEHIFKPKIDDFGVTASGDICVFSGERWLIDAGKRYIAADHADIIFRKKHFFLPKIQIY